MQAEQQKTVSSYSEAGIIGKSFIVSNPFDHGSPGPGFFNKYPRWRSIYIREIYTLCRDRAGSLCAYVHLKDRNSFVKGVKLETLLTDKEATPQELAEIKRRQKQRIKDSYPTLSYDFSPK